MQSVTSLNQVLQCISELPVEEQFYLADILNKRLIETRRAEIVDRVKEAEENYRQGNVYSGNVDRLMAMTEDD
jgi:SET domain-containing protein